MKSILVVSSSKFYGGGEVFISNVFFPLEKKYNIFYAVKNETLYSHCNKNNRIFLPKERRKSIKLINRYIKENNISAIVFNGNSILSPFIHCKFKIAYIHSNWQSYNKYLRNFIYFFLINISYIFCDKIIAVSKSVKPLFIWNYKTEIIYNGIDVNYFTPHKKDNNIPQLIFIGRIFYQKGIFELYEVLKKLSHDYKFKMTFVGEGPSLNELISKTKEDKLEKSIKFSGFINNVKNELFDSDILISPSYHEACSLSLLEAMSSELAVIVSDKGGSNEIIEHGVNGLLIDPFNEIDLYKNISDLISNKKYRTKLGFNARKTVIEKFSLEKSIEYINKNLNQTS